MSPEAGRPLQVALVHHSYGSPPAPGPEELVHALASALGAAGHRPHVLSAHSAPTRRSVEGGIPVLRSRRPPDELLRRRGFAGPLTHLPATARALLRGRYDLAHAFSPEDTLAALVWARLVQRPAVFGAADPPRRERLADRRLRLPVLRRALEDADAVIAPSEESRLGLLSWLAVEAPQLDPSDALAHEQLYRRLIENRRVGRRPAARS